MLGITQLDGFGVGCTDALLVNHLGGGSYTTTVLNYASFTGTTTVGRKGVLLSAADNAGTNGASCYNWSWYGSNSPQNATDIFQETQDPGAANAGVTLAVATAISQAASQGIGSTWNTGATAAAKAIIALEVYRQDGGGVEIVDYASGKGSGTTPSITTINPLQVGDLMIAFLAQEARTAPSTPDAGFTTQQSAIADTGTAGTSVVISYQTYTAVTDLANRNYAVTLGTTRDYVVGYLVLRATD